MRADDIDPEKMTRSQRIFSLPGGYRKIVMKPKEFTYSIHTYDDHLQPFVTTDWEVPFEFYPLIYQHLNGVTPHSLPDNGSKLALVIEMTLDSSTYATTLLRELTKTDMSSIAQRTLRAQTEDQPAKGGESQPADAGIEDQEELNEEEAALIAEAALEEGNVDVLDL